MQKMLAFVLLSLETLIIFGTSL